MPAGQPTCDGPEDELERRIVEQVSEPAAAA
jgi:hypothetical protein